MQETNQNKVVVIRLFKEGQEQHQKDQPVQVHSSNPLKVRIIPIHWDHSQVKT